MKDLINAIGTSDHNGLKEALDNDSILIWNTKVPNTELSKFQKVIERKYNQQFDSYWAFHRWSTNNHKLFWKEVWHYFKVIKSKPYKEVLVKTGKGFLDNEWFTGARFNLTENILRIKDNRIGLICSDELNNDESFTFSEINEQVKVYAAAFRTHGLGVGDRVGCYMSNRKEALFAMLAAISIGAMWGGPLPYYGPRAASKIMKMVDPKFIIAVDHCQNYGDECPLIDNLAQVAKGIKSLEKVIIVATRKETIYRDLSDVPNSIFLEDFLESAKTSDGSVPDITFEQLPFSHPTSINFTSGTTGSPKGVVHSAGAFIAQLRDFAFHLNLKAGDVVYNQCPVGWSVWDYLVPCLTLGVKLFLFDGSPEYYQKGATMWDNISKHKVSFVFLPPAYLDSLKTDNIYPEPDANLESLKTIVLGGSRVKPGNYEYLLNIKKDLFIGSFYGASEVFGAFSGFDFNLPSYAYECQVPALGVDLQCFDHKGTAVVGQKGELVVVKPTPSFPVFLWNDSNNSDLNEMYFSKFEGVWCQNDEGYINPVTNGIVIIGRSDDTLKHLGERMSSGDIYFAIDQMEELQDYICVCQSKWNGDSRAVLFVKLKTGYMFTQQLHDKIAQTISDELSDDNVPGVIKDVPDIPYNLNHKRMESTVKTIVATNRIPEVMNIRNPESLKYFCNIPELLDYNADEPSDKKDKNITKFHIENMTEMDTY